jgi:tRNA(fMet)-specific endonuclease VapC
MDYLWDTNILIHFVRNSETYQNLDEKHRFFEAGNRTFISVVSVGEIYSLAIQLDWGQRKIVELQNILARLSHYPINDEIILAYAQIDAFSQGKLKKSPLPKGITARNMGKNDIWIAATASVLQMPLLTLDNDFVHLSPTYLDIITL